MAPSDYAAIEKRIRSWMEESAYSLFNEGIFGAQATSTTATIENIRAQLLELDQKINRPIATEIRIGSVLKFRECLKNLNISLVEQRGQFWMEGLPVFISQIVPANTAIVMCGRDVLLVVDLDKTSIVPPQEKET